MRAQKSNRKLGISLHSLIIALNQGLKGSQHTKHKSVSLSISVFRTRRHKDDRITGWGWFGQRTRSWRYRRYNRGTQNISLVHNFKFQDKHEKTYGPIWTPLRSSSTSSSVIFSPSCVRTYLSSPAPMKPLPSLSNTWKPRMNSSRGLGGWCQMIGVCEERRYMCREYVVMSVPGVPAGLKPSGRLRIVRKLL